MRKLLVLFLIISWGSMRAQDFLGWRYTDRYFSLTAGTGKASYIGELNSKNRVQSKLANFNLGLEARLLTRISARAEIGYYNLKGFDYRSKIGSFEQQRNLSFRSWNLEGYLQGMYYIRKYGGDYYRRWPIDPYIHLGVGFSTYNPTAELNGTTYELRNLRIEGVEYGKTTLIIPAGIGVKFKLNEFITLTTEWAFRYTFTDYLDDVSTVFPEFTGDNVFSSLANRKDEIPVVNQEAYDRLVPGTPRGNPDNNDHYYFLNLKLEVFLPNRNGPIFKKPSAY